MIQFLDEGSVCPLDLDSDYAASLRFWHLFMLRVEQTGKELFVFRDTRIPPNASKNECMVRVSVVSTAKEHL